MAFYIKDSFVSRDNVCTKNWFYIVIEEILDEEYMTDWVSKDFS